MRDIKIDSIDNDIYEKVRKNWDAIAKPIDGLGDFEKLICQIAAITGREYPDLSKRALIIMCADNGVVKEGVSQTDQSVTRAVTELMTVQKSSVGIMTAGLGVDSFVVDVGVNGEAVSGTIDKKVASGTRDFLEGPAMSGEQCIQAIEAGIEIATECAKKGYGIIITGEMGIGNTTTSTALMCALTGCEPGLVTGAGAGLSAEGIVRKTEVIEQGLKLHGLMQQSTASTRIDDEVDIIQNRERKNAEIKGDGNKQVDIKQADVLHALSCVGGFDIAGLVGVFIGGAINHVPVLIDGFISAVAAYTAELIAPGTREYMIASHSGRESGTAMLLERLGLKPVIYADMALGEGTGAVMLLPLLDMAYRLYSSGTGFEDTDISSYERFKP